ncbi:DUF4276 family protein [Massilia sp.]|uniref:DUF4276 family protein n=1 Tax=Massilia sp. TaxID=1882437 RepID=UPI00289A4FAA|nr:DUF4276 family protein [Massilia sp.]
MYAILGEDSSDVEMLSTLVKRIAKRQNLTVKKMGYGGCAELLIKGAKQIRAYSRIGCTKFIICYDSDRAEPRARHAEIVEKVIAKSEIKGDFCALVPIQEIESWILADLPAVSKIIPSWKPTKIIHNPELQQDPKEYLEDLSKTAQHRPLYSHALHNPRIAEHLSLEKIARKCPSSLPLFELIQSGIGNHPWPKYGSNKDRIERIVENLTL